MEKENVIMQFISTWNWFMLAIIFFISSFLSVLIGGKYGFVMTIAFMTGAFVSSMISYQRKRKLMEREYD